MTACLYLLLSLKERASRGQWSKAQENEAPTAPLCQLVAQTWSSVPGLSVSCPCSAPGGRARGGPGAVCHEDQKDPQRPWEQGSVHGLVQG